MDAYRAAAHPVREAVLPHTPVLTTHGRGRLREWPGRIAGS